MFLEAAIGDAYGAGFEYVSTGIVRLHGPKLAYRQHPKWKTLKPGRYTDDTQMSIALAELALSKDLFNHYNWAKYVLDTFKRDPRAGYSQGFYDILNKVSSETELLQALWPHSTKNGGAMRAWVLGLIQDTGEVIDRAMFQASLTHATWDGMNSAAASALLTHYFYHGVGIKANVGDWIRSSLNIDKGFLSSAWKRPVGALGWDAVSAAVTAVTQGKSMTEVLKRCIAFTGDVDTVATIALAAASCSPEIKQDLPDSLIEGLENGTYGRDYLRQLDQRLLDAFPRSKEAF